MNSRIPTNRVPWWKGRRGEWLVAVQIALMALVFFGPRTLPGGFVGPIPFPSICHILGGVLMAAGGALLIAGFLRLGRGLTPLPYPKDGSVLVQTGPYALVRHPMYGGGILLALGWALYVRSWATIGYAILLFLFAEVKSRREEEWLAQRFPAYADYRRRVRKLIPFVY